MVRQILEALLAFLKESFSEKIPVDVQQTSPEPPIVIPKPPEVISEPPIPTPMPTPVPVTELLPWIFGKSLTHNNWKNVRIIADQEGLSLQLKEELCATIWGESEFNTAAKLNNRDKTGAVWSTDWGICQWNDYWHGKEIAPHDAVTNPEKAVRLMARYFKRGQANQWVAHSSGRYKKFMYKKL